MADFSSTIQIVDEFSTPLKDYTKELIEATDVTDMFKGALVDGVTYMKDMSDQTIENAIAVGSELVPQLHETASSARDVADAFKGMFADFGISSIKELTVALLGFVTNLYESGKSFVKLGWQIGKFIFMWKNGLSMLSVRITSYLTKAITDGYKKAFSYVNKVVGDNIEAISLEDKMVAMWGEAGKGANQRMYRLANELGENAGELMQAAAKAAANGIGTDDFEDIYRFADKISKLNPGDNASDVAQTLITSIKSGHDAESISGLLGGGEIMSRQLKRMGYERKLDHGDVQGALEIAKQVAEQAGYTQEKYDQAGNSMSNNFKFINNTISNIKKHMSELYARHFEPIVKKIADLMRSEKFQMFISIVEKVVDKIGSFVSGLIETLIDNWEIFAFMMGAMIAAKIVFATKLIGVVLKFRGVIWTVIKAVFRLAMGLKSMLLSMVGINKAGAGGIKGILRSAGAIAAIAGSVYLIWKYFDQINFEVDRFGNKNTTLKGQFAGFIKTAQNDFTNFFTAMEHAGVRCKQFWLRTKAGFYDAIVWIKNKYIEMIDWMISSIEGTFLQTIIEHSTGMNFNAFKALGQLATQDLRKDIEAETAESKKLYDEMAMLEKGMTQYIDRDQGVSEAIQTEGKEMFNDLAKLYGDLFGGIGDIFKTKSDEITGSINTNTDTIKKINEQEEELRWLKAFSDRQITSRYGRETSYNYNRSVTFNGMSQTSMDAHARSYAGFPSRSR